MNSLDTYDYDMPVPPEEQTYEGIRGDIEAARLNEAKLPERYKDTREAILQARLDHLVEHSPDYVFNLPDMVKNREEHVGGNLAILGRTADYDRLYGVLDQAVEKASGMYENVPSHEIGDKAQQLRDIINASEQLV